MYGGASFSSERITLDLNSAQKIEKENGSKQATVKLLLDEGWAHMQRGYFELAMRRFNQAWLLDSDNADVFHGFGLTLAAQNKFERSIDVYKKYLNSHPDHAITHCRLARQYQDKTVYLLQAFGEPKIKEAQENLAQAFSGYERAAGLAGSDEDLSFIYTQWAIGLALAKDFRGAWQKVYLSKKHGGQFIEQGFLDSLSKDMPDPGEMPAQNA